MRDAYSEVGAAMRASNPAHAITAESSAPVATERPATSTAMRVPMTSGEWDGRFARRLIDLHPYAARRFYVPAPTPDTMDRVILALSVGGFIGFAALMLAGVL